MWIRFKGGMIDSGCVEQIFLDKTDLKFEAGGEVLFTIPHSDERRAFGSLNYVYKKLEIGSPCCMIDNSMSYD